MSDLSPAVERLATTRRSEVLRPGDVIAGKYRVQTILGRERGLLLDAIHTETDHRVAIRFLPVGGSNEKEIERFRREGRTLAKLGSEHVAHILDVGSEPDGSLFLVRQYLEGIDLGRYLRQTGPLPLAEAVLLIAQAAEAVAEAHANGIIVRELEPSHLFLTERVGGAPLLKVIDFGTAKPNRGSDAPSAGVEITATAMFGVSPYASPELVRKAKSVDLRMDVWSLGAIFYQMLAGRVPFAGETAELMLQITREEPEPLSRIRPDLPPELDAIIGWAMAKDVDGRFRNVHAFVHALLPYAPVEAQMLAHRIEHMTRAAKARKQGAAVEGAGRSIAPMAPIVTTPALSRPLAATVLSQPLAATSPAVAARAEEIPGPSASAVVPEPMPAVVVTIAPPAEAPAAALPPPLPRIVQMAPPPRNWTSFENGLAFLSGAIPVLLGALVLSQMHPPKSPLRVEARERTRTTAELSAVAPKKTESAAKGDMAARSVAAAKAEAVAKADVAAKTEPVQKAEPVAKTDLAAKAEPAANTEAVAKADAAAKTEPVAAPAEQMVLASANTEHRVKPAASHSKRTSAKARSQSKSSGSDSDEGVDDVEDASASPSASGGEANGTLFAVVTGGSCAFSVNGASKGISTSLKLSVRPGNYSITCKTPGGEPTSKSVTVKENQAVFTTFKGRESS